MSGENQDNQADIVDDVIRTLRAAPLPDGPSEEALARTLAAVRAAEAAPVRSTWMERIRSMNRWTKVAAVAAVIAATTTGWFLLFGDGKGLAFAEVKKRVQAAETFACKMVISAKGMKQPIVVEAMFKEPGRMRYEAAVGSITIVDVSKGKLITLNPKAKEATDLNLADLPAAQREQMNLLAELKELLDGKPTDLGEEKIDGVRARHYRVTPAEQTAGEFVTDIWVDAETRDIIRVELAGGVHDYRITITDFKLNAKLDDALFSVEIPKGYSAVRIGRPTWPDVIGGLRLMATVHGGAFPELLAMDIELYKKLQRTVPKAELKEKWLMLGRMLLFVESHVQAGQWSDWKYVGGGVKLGDRDKPVMHWLPKGAAKHKVLYGDLKRIEDADASKLPGQATTKAAA
jgi:outer membrane lipoprotein-sorting protein